ncbi:MAG: PPC domain-containing protein [Planctomycetota bacterium]|jgi:hypothetical protein
MSSKWAHLLLAVSLAFFASPFLAGGCNGDDDDKKMMLAFAAHVAATEDSHEPDSDPWDADAKGFFAPGSTFGGTSWDMDVYAIDVPGGSLNVTINCTFTHAEGDLDISLIDSAMNELAYSDGIVDNETIIHTVPSAGTYYIVVYILEMFGGMMGTGQQYGLIWTCN